MPDPNLNPLVIRIDNYARGQITYLEGDNMVVDSQPDPSLWRCFVRNAIRLAVARNQCFGNREDYPAIVIFGEEREVDITPEDGNNPPTAIIIVENLLFNDMSGGNDDIDERHTFLHALQKTLRIYLPKGESWTIAIIDRCHSNSTHAYPPPS